MKKFSGIFAVIMIAVLLVSIFVVVINNEGFNGIIEAIKGLNVNVTVDNSGLESELAEVNDNLNKLVDAYNDNQQKLADEVAKLSQQLEDSFQENESFHQEVIKLLKSKGLCCTCCKCSTKPAETTCPAETKPAETKPAETKPAETKPAETKPAETKPAQTHSYSYVAKTDKTHVKICSCGINSVENCTYQNGKCIYCGNTQLVVNECKLVYVAVAGGVHHMYCDVHVNEQEVQACTFQNGTCKYCEGKENKVIEGGNTFADPDFSGPVQQPDTPAQPDNDSAKPDDTQAKPDSGHEHKMVYIPATSSTHHAYCDDCVNHQYEEDCIFVNGSCKHCGNQQCDEGSSESSFKNPFN